MIKKIGAVMAAALLATGAQGANVVDFEDQAVGSRANGYTVGGITFNDTSGADLSVSNFGSQGVGSRSLGVFNDDNSALEMLFAGTAIDLSLTFGNDDSCCSLAGDVAWLRIFDGATQVGSTTVVLNRDDVANQTIGISGIAFNRALFVYARGQNPINLIEIVDNITYTAVDAVPEPATWAMMIGGFGLVGAATRRRAKASVQFA